MIKNNFGLVFPNSLPFAVLLGIPGLLSFLSGDFYAIIIGIGLIIVPGFFGYTTYGIKIDSLSNKFMEYSRYYFFLYGGKWRSLDEFKYVSYRGVDEGLSVPRLGFMQSRIFRTFQYKVMLTCLWQKEIVYVKEFDDREEAVDYGKELAKTLGKEFIKFDPPEYKALRRRKRFARRRNNY